MALYDWEIIITHITATKDLLVCVTNDLAKPINERGQISASRYQLLASLATGTISRCFV